MATAEELLLRARSSYEEGVLAEAEQLCQQVLEAEPGNAAAHYLLGLTLKRQGRLADAVASFQQAIYCRPDFPEAYQELGASFQHSTQFHAHTAQTYNDLGGPLFHQGRLDEALASFKEALRLDPNYAEAHLNIGAVFQAQGKLDEAVASYRQAAACRPDLAQAHSDLGAALHRLGKAQEARNCFQEAVRCQHDFADAHHNLGILHLLLGNLEQGWAEYEWRWQTKDFHDWFWQPRDFHLRHFPQPRWDGTSLDGRTILLQAEQGLGDTLQFIRYAAPIRDRGGRVIVQGCTGLEALIRTCPGVERVLDEGEPLPPFDAHAYLLSLPLLFETTLANMPADVPYLGAEPERVDRWRQELSSITGKRIGIVWQGSKSNKHDVYRSVALKEFAPLARIQGVSLLSLQVGTGVEQLSGLDGVMDLGSRFDSSSLADAAAVINNLDLLITVDTALAHLAGALAVPVWIVLPLSPDWRWLQEREDSPWYPTARLFRQRRLGDWSEVFARMADELARQHW